MSIALLTERHKQFREFRRLWTRWRRVLDHFARARGGKPISAATYQDLYRQLLDQTSAYQETAAQQIRPALAQMEKIVRPWMTLESLATANRTMLARLVVQSHRAEVGVFGRIAAFSGLKVAALMVVSVFVLALGVWAVSAWHTPDLSGGFMDQLLIEIKRGTWRLLATSDPYRATLAGLIALLISAWFVTSMQKY